MDTALAVKRTADYGLRTSDFGLGLQTAHSRPGRPEGLRYRRSARCTPHAAPCTLHAAPCTLHPARCTLHAAPCTLHPAPCTLDPAPWHPHPATCPLHLCRSPHPPLCPLPIAWTRPSSISTFNRRFSRILTPANSSMPRA